MRISDWSSDVCSSDLERLQRAQVGDGAARRPSQRGGRGRFATLQQGQRILQREAIARRLDTSRHRVRERCPVLQVGRERQGDELASGLAVEPLPLAIVHQRLATGNPPQVERLRRGNVVRNRSEERRVGNEWGSTYRSWWPA